jgi:hypothetical protein
MIRFGRLRETLSQSCGAGKLGSTPACFPALQPQSSLALDADTMFQAREVISQEFPLPLCQLRSRGRPDLGGNEEKYC